MGLYTKNGKSTRETTIMTINKQLQLTSKQAIKQSTMAKNNLSQLQELTDKLSNLENAIKGLSIKPNGDKEKEKEKKPRNMTDAGALHKAKLIYYQEMKSSNEVKVLLKAKDLDNISFKNWRVAKEVTDQLFDKLSQAKKDTYIKKAQDTKDSE